MKKNIIILCFILTSITACGPRSGIHEEYKDNTPNCGVVDNPNPSISAQTQSQENGRKIFKQNCAVCHSITDQKLTGPGFRGLLDRLPDHSDYFKKYVTNSDSIVKSGNSYSLKLHTEYDIDFVHNLANYNYPLSSNDIDDLIEFVKIIDLPIP